MSTEEILVFAIVNELFIGEIKKIIKNEKISWEIVSFITGFLFTTVFYIYKGNIIDSIIKIVFEGFVIARGSNFLFKIINTLDYKKESLKNNIMGGKYEK